MPDQNNNDLENTKKKGLIKRIFAGIFNKFCKLKQKKYWIPLVIGHAIMFFAFGYFVYEEEEKIIKHITAYDVTATVNKALETNDPALLTTILNIPILTDNTEKTIRDNLKSYSDLDSYVGELPNTREFNDYVSLVLLNVIKADDTTLPFDEKLDIIPTKLPSQLRKTPFAINQELSDPKTQTYVLETKIQTIKWGSYPLRLTAKLQDNTWGIIEIANLQEIMEIHDKELKRQKEQSKNRTLLEKKELLDNVARHLPNPTCVASITELSGQKVLIIRVDTERNRAEQDIVSWAVDVVINFEDGSLFKEEYLKINGVFSAKEVVSNTWNMTLTEEDNKHPLDKKLLCTAKAVFVNLPDGNFFEITK